MNMSILQISDLIQAIFNASLSLMGVSVTLIALIPVLVEIARSRSPDFFTGEESKDKLKRYLSRLGYTIVIFNISAIASIISFFYENAFVVGVALSTFGIGLIVLVLTSLAMARLTLKHI